MSPNERVKKSSFKVLLAVCTALAGAIWAMASNWGDIIEFLHTARSAATRYSNRSSVAPMATTRLRELLAAETTPRRLDPAKYRLALDVKAKYQSARFADDANLRSLSPLEIHSPQSFVLAQTMRESVNNGNMEWTFWGQSASALTELYFSTGPKTWKLSLDEKDWRREHMAVQSNSTIRGAVVQIVLDKPNWLVLASARLLDAADPSMHVLEIILRNYTDSEFLIEDVHLDARQPRASDGPRCGTHGIVGDPPQEIVVDWERVIETGGEDGAWTMFAQTLVNVEATVRYGKCKGENHYFGARIPSELSVGPGDKARYVFRVQQQSGWIHGQQPRQYGGFSSFLDLRRLFGRLVTSINNPLVGVSRNPLLWEHLEVGIDGDGVVSPRRLLVAANADRD